MVDSGGHRLWKKRTLNVCPNAKEVMAINASKKLIANWPTLPKYLNKPFNTPIGAPMMSAEAMAINNTPTDMDHM